MDTNKQKNKDEMVELCQKQIDWNSKSKSIWAKWRKAYWESQLKYWQSIY